MLMLWTQRRPKNHRAFAWVISVLKVIVWWNTPHSKICIDSLNCTRKNQQQQQQQREMTKTARGETKPSTNKSKSQRLMFIVIMNMNITSWLFERSFFCCSLTYTIIHELALALPALSVVIVGWSFFGIAFARDRPHFNHFENSNRVIRHISLLFCSLAQI